MLAYASVVVIMILFFLASTLFNEVEVVKKKVFSTEIIDKNIDEVPSKNQEVDSVKFKLMPKAY